MRSRLSHSAIFPRPTFQALFVLRSPDHALLISFGSRYRCIIYTPKMTSDLKSPHLPDIRQSTSAEAEPAPNQARARATRGAVGSRRRKVPDSVTPNACTNCKKARAKVIDALLDAMRHLTLGDERTKWYLVVRRCQARMQTVLGASHSG